MGYRPLLHSQKIRTCCAGAVFSAVPYRCAVLTIRRLQFLRYDFGHTPSLPSPPVSSSLTAPVLRLRSVTQATSAAPTRPYQQCWHRTQTRPSCKSRKDRTTSPEHIPARLLPRRTGLPAHSPEIFKTTAAAVPSKTSSESSGEVNAMFNVSAKLDRPASIQRW